MLSLVLVSANLPNVYILLPALGTRMLCKGEKQLSLGRNCMETEIRAIPGRARGTLHQLHDASEVQHTSRRCSCAR